MATLQPSIQVFTTCLYVLGGVTCWFLWSCRVTVISWSPHGLLITTWGRGHSTHSRTALYDSYTLSTLWRHLVQAARTSCQLSMLQQLFNSINKNTSWVVFQRSTDTAQGHSRLGLSVCTRPCGVCVCTSLVLQLPGKCCSTTAGTVSRPCDKSGQGPSGLWFTASCQLSKCFLFSYITIWDTVQF